MRIIQIIPPRISIVASRDSLKTKEGKILGQNIYSGQKRCMGYLDGLKGQPTQRGTRGLIHQSTKVAPHQCRGINHYRRPGRSCRSTFRVGAVKKHPRADRASHQISTQLRGYLTSKSLIPPGG